jgi:uncharacterized integral membrane protein
MRYVTGILAVVVLLIVTAFSIQNRQSVDVSFLVWSMSIPKVFLVLGTFVLGMICGSGLLALLKRAF